MEENATQLFRMLIEAGATPGKDFSCDETRQTYRMSERAYILLQLAYPELDLSQFASRTERDDVAAAAALNAQLGTDFTGQLMTRMNERRQQLQPLTLVWYLQQILNGVERRTGVSLYRLWHAQLPTDAQQQVDQLLEQSTAALCNLWMQDLVDAAGGDTADVAIEGDDVWLTDRGLALLTTVWEGDYDLSEDEPEQE